jgi:hypothetical protein
MVKAATDFFKPAPRSLISGDSAHTFDIDYSSDFVLVEDRARTLYDSKFSQSLLASKIYLSTEDSTSVEKLSGQTHKVLHPRHDEFGFNPASSYPSPTPSPREFPEYSPELVSIHALPPHMDSDFSDNGTPSVEALSVTSQSSISLHLDQVSAYPSPLWSPENSPEPSPPVPSIADTTSNRKRKHSYISLDSPEDISSERQMKRVRFVSSCLFR